MQINKYEKPVTAKEEMTYFMGRVRKHLLALVIGAGVLSVLITPLQGLGFWVPVFYYLVMWGFGYGLMYLHCRFTGKGKDER